MNGTKDKYDLAIEYLTEYPEEIKDAWVSCKHPASCLFQFVTPSGRNTEPYGGSCPTMIRTGYEGWTPEITARIRNNQFIPANLGDINIGNLIHFAEEQRRLDKEIRNQ